MAIGKAFVVCPCPVQEIPPPFRLILLVCRISLSAFAKPLCNFHECNRKTQTYLIQTHASGRRCTCHNNDSLKGNPRRCAHNRQTGARRRHFTEGHPLPMRRAWPCREELPQKGCRKRPSCQGIERDGAMDLANAERKKTYVTCMLVDVDDAHAKQS
jgi:hypothetical protein